MKILIITQWFEPEFTLKGLLLAKKMKEQGHEVEILTGFPNYPEGKIYQGYQMKPFLKEVVDGITVIRCALYPSHDNSAVRRAGNYLSFAISSAFWGALLCKRPDVIYAYHPPITIGLPSAVISLLKRAPFVLDIQDFWPDTLKSTGMMSNRHLYNCVGIACRMIYRLAERIVVLSPGFKGLLMDRGVPEEKIDIVYNWADERYIKPRPYDKKLATKMGFSGKFNVVFAGTLGRAQNLKNVLKAARILKDTHPDIQIVFIGKGVEEDMLKEYVHENDLSNVVFEPRRPIDQILEVLAISDVLLMHLKDDPLFDVTVPSKTQANLCVGRPNLAVCRGDAGELIESAGAGLTCLPGDPQALAKSIIELYAMSPEDRQKMGDNGSRYYRNHLSLDSGVQKTLDLLRQIVRQKGNKR